MHDKAERKRVKLILYLASGLAAAAILLIVYAINGIYPFGSESVVYDDLVQNSVPVLTAFWDVLHGDASPLFNWNTGAGVSIFHNVTEFFSPFSPLFFLICPRDSITEWMSYFVMLKLVLMSLTMMFFIEKHFRIASVWKIVLSLLYPFSGYVLQLYTNIEWLDIAIFFPLLITALLHLFKKGKILPYILLLALCAARSLYITYMVYLFLIFVGGLYIILIVPKNTRKTSIYNFGLGSVFGLLVSAAISLPSFFYLTTTSRYESTKGFIGILSAENILSNPKLGMVIIMTALPFSVICLMLLKFREEKKSISFIFLSLGTLGLQVFFESINLFWHMGSYVLFPMRYAFMLSFVIIAGCAYALERFGSELFKSNGLKSRLMVILGLAFAGGAAYLFLSGRVYSQVTDSAYKYEAFFDNVFFALIFFILVFACYIILFKFGSKRVGSILICLVFAFETGVSVNRAFSKSLVRASEYNTSFIYDCLNITANTSLKNDNLSRIKNSDSSLNSNYPLVLNHSALSNFTHLIPPQISSAMKSLGYSRVYTRVLDTGGTLLTDALLNCKHTLTTKTLDDDAYTLLETMGEYNIYSDNYTLPFGLVVGEGILNESFLDGNALENNNKIYKLLSGGSEGIFEVLTVPSKTYKNSVSFSVKVEGTKRLYCSNALTDFFSGSFSVNGRIIEIPTLGNSNNMLYKALFNNNLVDLGTFTDETVNVTFVAMNNKADFSSVMVGVMDTAKLDKLCKSYENYDSNASAIGRTLELDVKSNSDGEYLFLPVVYYDSWACRVNGVKTEPIQVMGSFMAVKLTNGENHVLMKYTPKGLNQGIVISLLSFACLALILIRRRKRALDPESSGLAFKILEKGYIVGIIVLFEVFYVFPIIFTLLQQLFLQQL